MIIPITDCLKKYSYYKTGGECKFIYFPKSIKQVDLALKDINKRGLKYFVLGGGSKSLIMDEPYPYAVIVMKNLKDVVFDNGYVTAQAGINTSKLTEMCAKRGLDGLAWLHGLPGQIGGAIKMNARCYGGEISEVVNTVQAIDKNGNLKTYKASDVFLGYKDTLFFVNDEIIVSVIFKLKKARPDVIKQKMEECLKDRVLKAQFQWPSCGCVFKNKLDLGIPSSVLLEYAGVKDLKVGNAQVSNVHANFVWNKGASSKDILELTFIMRDKVYEKFGIWLEYEMQLLGFIPDDIYNKFFEKRPDNPKINELDKIQNFLKN